MRPKTFLCIINLNPNSHGGGRVCARARAGCVCARASCLVPVRSRHGRGMFASEANFSYMFTLN